MCIHAWHVYVCMYVNDYATVHVWRSERNFLCQSLLSILFETGSLLFYSVIQATWPVAFWRFSCSHLPYQGRNTGIADACFCARLYPVMRLAMLFTLAQLALDLLRHPLESHSFVFCKALSVTATN